MRAVKRPGSLYFSAIALFLDHRDIANLGSVIGPGSFLVACAWMSSMTAALASAGPLANMSCHFLSVGSFINSGLPALISVITPIMSEWSATATQSSGVPSLTGCPLLAVTSSPRAKRVASSGPSVVPKPPASIDHAVWTCSSPK